MTPANIYTREALLYRLDNRGAFEYLLFYGHEKSLDGAITDTCLSQWFPASFTVDDVEYLTAEHYMMAEKARLFNDGETLQSIIKSRTPREAKALGRKVHNYDSEEWANVAFDVVVKGNRAKFLQNAALGEWLRSTVSNVLVEASPSDRIWGVGLGRSDPKALNPQHWRGSNQLGFALMKVRDTI